MKILKLTMGVPAPVASTEKIRKYPSLQLLLSLSLLFSTDFSSALSPAAPFPPLSTAAPFPPPSPSTSPAPDPLSLSRRRLSLPLSSLHLSPSRWPMASGAGEVVSIARSSLGRAHDPSRRRRRPEAAKPPLVAASPRHRRRPRFRRRRRPEAADPAPSCVDLAPSWPDQDGAASTAPHRGGGHDSGGGCCVGRCRHRLRRSSPSPSRHRLTPLSLAALSLPLSPVAGGREGWKGKFFGRNGVHRPRSCPTRPLGCVPLPKTSEGHVPQQRDSFHHGGMTPTIKQTVTDGGG